jgi:predicted Zn-dependent protease
MSDPLIIGLMIGIPVVISLFGYTAYSAITTKNIVDRNSITSSRSSGTFRYIPDRQISTYMDTNGKRLINLSKEGGYRKTKRKI